VELLFWGYLLQFHFRNFIICQWEGTSYNTDWFFAFHVLQSIAVALLFLMLSFFISKLSRIPFYLVSLLIGIFVFGCNGILESYIREQRSFLDAGLISHLNYIPSNAPRWVQNMFFGIYSEFSFVRFTGFAMIGGSLGHIICLYKNDIVSFIFGATLLCAGYVLRMDAYYLLEDIDRILIELDFQNLAYQMGNKDSIIKLGSVISFIGLLVMLNRLFDFKQNLILKMGQNTLPIYIIHVILIYEGLLGFGLPLKNYKENLSPIQSWMISLFIISWFFVLIHYWERIEKWWGSIIQGIRKREI
jgi:hypothetical protein